jgi:hypothetical protein
VVLKKNCQLPFGDGEKILGLTTRSVKLMAFELAIKLGLPNSRLEVAVKLYEPTSGTEFAQAQKLLRQQD